MKPFKGRGSANHPPVWITGAQRVAFDGAETTAHRLASGSGGWVERLGEDVIVSFKSDDAKTELLKGLKLWTSKTDWSPTRVFTRFMPTRNAERVSPILHEGDASLSLKTTVTEAGIRYRLDIAAGYSHGLFLDQRLNRARLQNLQPKRVLNTFAYTCSFSVVAALAGAETVSVDLSRKSLDRGRHNFELNDLDPARHRFEADDTLELLPQLASQHESFDAIILDPPTFSRSGKGKGRRWRVVADFENLLMNALEVAAPNCAILLSTNCTKLNSAELRRRARLCAKAGRQTADYLEMESPIDFPPGHGASTLWMMLR
ncbi:MAG: class I SAM-dependent methyltransferase [Limisphaerales bacterium]